MKHGHAYTTFSQFFHRGRAATPPHPPCRELQLGTSPQARAAKRAPGFTVLGRKRPERAQSPTSFWRFAGCEISARVQQHDRCDGRRREREEVLGFKLHIFIFFFSFLTAPYRKRLEEARILFCLLAFRYLALKSKPVGERPKEAGQATAARPPLRGACGRPRGEGP